MNLFIRKLITDHSHLNAQISFLLDAIERIKENGFNRDDFSIIKKAIDYFNNELKQHNKLEEEHLFTKIKSSQSLQNITTSLKAEHRIMWDKLNILISEVNKYEINYSIQEFSELYKISISLIILLRNHIEKENEKFFPLIEKMLTPNEIDELNQLVNL